MDAIRTAGPWLEVIQAGSVEAASSRQGPSSGLSDDTLLSFALGSELCLCTDPRSCRPGAKLHSAMSSIHFSVLRTCVFCSRAAACRWLRRGPGGYL